jgi:peptide/nickel transport system substrate-binding protein
MQRNLTGLAAAGALLLAMATAPPASAQKQGGILHLGHFDSPASMSLLEESTQAVNRPMSGVFNNLVTFKQDVKQNSLKSIVPYLAESWAWNEEGTELTLPLRQGVKWHDGRPFTAADVKCTIDLLMGKAKEKLRINPRKSWFDNVADVTTNGDFEVTFHLKRAQPSFLALLATGWSPVYPCHVSPRTCAANRSAPARSSSSRSSRTSRSRSPATRNTGRRGGPISTASSTRSSRTSRPGSCRSSPARTTPISPLRSRS